MSGIIIYNYIYITLYNILNPPKDSNEERLMVQISKTIYALKFLKRAKNQEHIRFSPCLKLDLHFPCDHWDACKPATAYGPL